MKKPCKNRLFLHLFTTLSLLLVMLLSTSCKDNMTQKEYRTDVSLPTLSATAEKHIALHESMISLNERYFSSVFDLSPDEYDTFIAKRAEDIACDEYGIFSCKDSMTARRLKAHLNDELDDMKEDWDDRYFPDEKEKIDAARAEVFGNIVVYTVLYEHEQAQFFDAIERTLAA